MENYRNETAACVTSRMTAPGTDWQKRLYREPAAFAQDKKMPALPAISEYWANTHLVPHKFHEFGITDVEHFFYLYVKKYHDRFPARSMRMVSLGTGNVDMESRLARKLLDDNIANFRIDCIDVTAAAPTSTMAYSRNADMAARVVLQAGGVNNWQPEHPCDIVIASQSLHNVRDLEYLFSMISATLADEGVFLVSDVIGKNGHQLWPESLSLVEEFWRQLPARYKYNHMLQRLELKYGNHDYSAGVPGGMRSQEILPMLNDLFNFELFIPFANVIPVFIDRPFGYNFNAGSEWDQDFIDRVHERDEQGILSGELKPAQMLAALCREPVETRLVDARLTPEFCIRHASYN